MDKLVLIVDDDPLIGKSLTRLLKHNGMQATHVLSAEEALETLTRFDFQVAIIDQAMPGLSGTDLITRLGLYYPDIVRIMLTGHTDLEILHQVINETGVFRFFFKPWQDELLVSALNQAFNIHSTKFKEQQLKEELARANLELKHQHEAMQRALDSQIAIEERLQVLIDALPSAILLYDDDAKVIEHNNNFSSWFTEEHSCIGLDLSLIPKNLQLISKEPGWHNISQNGQSYRVYVGIVTVNDIMDWLMVLSPVSVI